MPQPVTEHTVYNTMSPRKVQTQFTQFLDIYLLAKRHHGEFKKSKNRAAHGVARYYRNSFLSSN